MSRVTALFLTTIMASWTIWSCSESNFTGSNKGPSSTTACKPDDAECLAKNPNVTCDDKSENCATANPPPAGPPTTTSDKCVDGDKVNFAWTGEEKTCIVDQGKTYNFDLNKCAEMRQSQFTCDWEHLKDELTKRNLLTSVLKADSENGAKLVSCGQSQDGNRIVVQWIKLTDATAGECTYKAANHHITTGCYTVYTNGATPPQAGSEDERRKQVFDCMNQL